MQVVGRCFVTNITGDPVLILGAKLLKTATDGHVFVRHPNKNIFGGYQIPPGVTTEVSTDFWVQPVKKRLGEDFVSNVVLIDQYGNHHRIKRVRFRNQPPESKPSGPEKEPVHSISDPIEKKIVSVLKSEVDRYAECGRRVGGLGSIQTIIDGNPFVGVGADSRESHTPKEQAIIADPDTVLINSDNAESLDALYKTLSTEEERGRYVDILLSRLSKSTEYAPIGYFILYALFRVGQLSQGLKKARAELEGDAAFGFSDFLRFLDALLRFKHSAFDEESLDEIEQFVSDLKEHTFRIPERLIAIRARRLRD